MKKIHALFACLALYFAAGPLFAQGGYGEVSFANSRAPAAQPDFQLGLAMLHDFEYEDAAAHFQKAQQIDPGFAMAYWGEAMTKNHPVWQEQDLAEGRAVLNKLAPTPEARAAKAPTEREKMYIHSLEILYGHGTKAERDLAYESAMAALHQKYPDDVDAAAFYALSILGSAENGRDYATYMRAAAVLEEVFPSHPHHPGVVHYLIHCYDDPIHAPLGLRPARIYSQIAPDAGHAQHMTSHIFLALGMWADVVRANETAIAVVNAQSHRRGQPNEVCGHYAEWLEYGYVQMGRTDDARRLLAACHDEANTYAGSSKPPANGATYSQSHSVGSYSEIRTDFLINTQLWNDPVAGWTLPQGASPVAQLTFDYGTALAALERRDLPVSLSTASALQQDREAVRKLAVAAPSAYSLQQGDRAEIIIDQVNAFLLLKGGQSDSAVSLLREAVEKEKALPVDFGPPFINKPSEELLGEMYLRLNRPKDAAAAFQSSLARAPGRRLSSEGLSSAASIPAPTGSSPSVTSEKHTAP